MNWFSPSNLFNRGAMFSRKWIANPGGVYSKHEARIERDLQVNKRARDNGRNNLPATTATEPDVVQQHIIDRFGTGADAINQALWNRLKGALDRVGQLIPEGLEQQSIAQAAELAIKRVRDRAYNPLVALKKQERDHWRDLQRFRSENDLTGRSPSYPVPWPPLKLWFWIVLAFVVESLLNGGIFAQANAQGWEGGVIQAVTFSAVNILLGFFFLGFIVARYAGHVTPWKRIAGVLGIMAVVVTGMTFNLYVAHYREVIERIPLDQIDALARSSYVNAAADMRAHPIGFTAWQAIVLLIIGLSVFVGLAIKGYFADDPYPAFGRHDRAYKRALRAYEDGQAKVKKAVEKVIDAATKQVKGRIAEEARGVEEARAALAESEQAEREAADSVADLARGCTAKLRVYREINCYVRTTAPPDYFKVYPTFSVDLPEMPAIKARFQEAISAQKCNQAAANQIERHLNEISKAALDGFLAYVEGIELQAVRRIEEEALPKAA